MCPDCGNAICRECGVCHHCFRGACYGLLEPIRRTYDADELGIDQEDDD